ncbi:TATA-box binding [Thermosyntropha lipolytica DSM 11003]|uniref:TATA-box binding n=1 Tax=Thermosyntropha lipolytica DSM 11003 TaxID=1123382 RepID=A0A1M5NUB5_9FIRM|nr:YwmB family TATA-box binding protein [Thermosyntropha lipolytica]SHG92779.1 TATA-box binding [Thermosyntropha lipolytica DSM 11003]
MPKILLYITIFTLLCFCGNYSIDCAISKQLANRSPYSLAFASIGANSLTSNLDAWVKIKTESSKAELEAYLTEIVTSLDFPLITEKIVYSEEDRVKAVFYQLKQNNCQLNVVLESDEAKRETYVVVNITVKGNKTEVLKKYACQLPPIANLEWTCYFTYRAYIANIIAGDAQGEIIKVMLKNLQAREISWYRNGKITSCAAYSPSLKPFTSAVQVAGEKYNLQIAVQPDEKRNRTYIIIGSPLILGEY